jgi:hypothetical protein
MRTVVTTEGIFHVKETYEEIQQLVLQWDWIELNQLDFQTGLDAGKITMNRVQIVLFY